MIERLEKAREWGSRLLVSFVIVAAVAKDYVFAAVLKGPPADPHALGQVTHASVPMYVSAIYILALIFIYSTLEVAADAAIDGSRRVRRWLMGKDDIEGYWLNIVYQSDRIIAGGVLYIYYENRSYKMEGRDFDLDGVWRGWFGTDISRYSNRCLSYKYHALRPGPRDDGTGHGENNFTSGGPGSIRQFDGYFFEDRNERRFYVHGERLLDFIDDTDDLRSAMSAISVPPLVARFIDERKDAMPVVRSGHEQPDAPEMRSWRQKLRDWWR
jgi:hypothetical protein